jgi:hypothetical protein
MLIEALVAPLLHWYMNPDGCAASVSAIPEHMIAGPDIEGLAGTTLVQLRVLVSVTSTVYTLSKLVHERQVPFR